jgi:molybdate transport system permease protein
VIAGSLPGTRTLAVSIYTFAETGRDREAAILLAVSAAIAFVALYLSNRIASTSARKEQALGQAAGRTGMRA